MALTATAQSALREPGWDEVIVPTLRKRLQTESNMIAKRLSAASLASIDDHSGDIYQPGNLVSRQELQTQYYSNHKPSAIPRPSLQQTRTSESPNSPAHPQPTRTRTLSALDSPNLSSTSSRPTSPMTSGKTTRIPVSRVRAGSTSSYAQGSIHGSIGRTDEVSHPGHSRTNGDIDTSELWPVDETHRGYSSRSTVRIPHRKASQLSKETATLGANSITSDFEQGMSGPYRVSSDSEERPYEHWYRGDVARNGGVGELRIGRREEMLDIANYGHTFQKASSRIAISSYSRSRSNSRSRDRSSRLRARQRAESVGAATRESIYLDDDDPEEDAYMVLDEQPLTDLDGESDEGPEMDSYERGVLPHPNGTISSPSLTLNGNQISQSHVAKQRTGLSVSRIPTPTFQRQASAPPRTPTPTKFARGSSETSLTPSTPQSTQRLPRSQSRPQGQRTSPNAKRKAKSPAGTGSVSAAKKAKTKPPSSMKTTVSRSEQNRRSVGQYPAADGDNMMDAIPSWTQPVPTSGNWDDVVLPVVARKKGLEGHYATADGSPRPPHPQTKSAVYEPAPGTFGFDHSKYRRKDSGGEEVIQMDEFGHKMNVVREEPQHVTEQPEPLLPPTVVERTHSRTSPPSPPPFARYVQPDTGHQKVESSFIQPIIQTRNEMSDTRPDDDAGAGCCRCVIM